MRISYRSLVLYYRLSLTDVQIKLQNLDNDEARMARLQTTLSVFTIHPDDTPSEFLEVSFFPFSLKTIPGCHNPLPVHLQCGGQPEEHQVYHGDSNEHESS